MSRRVLQSERKRLPGLMVELNKGSGPPCLAALGAPSPMSSRQEPSSDTARIGEFNSHLGNPHLNCTHGIAEDSGLKYLPPLAPKAT